MGVKVTKFRLFAAGILLLILAACVCGVLFFSLKSCRQQERMRGAMEAFERGNYKKAKRDFIVICRQDRNNETATVKLAEIFEKEGNWADAALFWNTAAHLNSQRPEYRTRKLEAEMRSGDAKSLFAECAKNEKSLTPEERLGFIWAAYRCGNTDRAEQEYEKLKRDQPSALDSDRGRMMALMLRLNLTDGAKTPVPTDALEKLTNDRDPFIVYESLLTLAGVCQYNRAPQEKIESLLKKAAEINPRQGGIHLFFFYHATRQYQPAILQLENFLRDFPDTREAPEFAVRLGDLYVVTHGDLQKQSGPELKPLLDLLSELSKKFRDGTRERMLAGYYIDAISAALQDNDAELKKAMNLTDGRITSPLARLLMLRVALANEDYRGAEQQIRAIRSDPPFRTYQLRAYQMTRDFLRDQVEKKKPLAPLASLAEAIASSDSSDLFLVRILTFYTMNTQSLSRQQLRQTLQRFLNDPLLLFHAAAYSLRQKDFRDSLDYAAKFRKLLGEKIKPDASASLYLIQYLDHLALKDENSAADDLEKRLLLSPDEDERLTQYYDFCVQYKLKKRLTALKQHLSEKNDPERADFRDFAAAEITLLEGRTADALDRMNAIPTERANLLLRAGYLLATHNRDAEAAVKYRKLLTLPEINRALPLIQLSEIEHSLGHQEEACRCAQNAYQISPKIPEVVHCYAKRLLENGDCEQAAALIGKHLPREREQTPPLLLGPWSAAMEKCIVKFAEAKLDQRYRNAVRDLLYYVPGNTFAQNEQKKIDAADELRRLKKK